MFFTNTVLALSMLTTLAIAATEVPLWISAFAVTTLLWRFAFERFNFPRISNLLATVAALFVFLIVYLQYKTVFGQEESTAILVALASVAIFNYESDRDTYFVILLGFLLVALKSIFNLDIVWIPPAIISFFGLWYSLISSRKINKTTFLLITTLRALPLFIFLFVVFPRFVIFQTKKVQSQTTKTGFSEDLNPGQVSELALQNQVVFTAKLENTKMQSDQLYWRGSVLTASNGLIWKKTFSVRSNKKPNLATGNTLDYQIILDPLNLKNVFLLDVPIKIISSNLPIQQFADQIFYLNQSAASQVQIRAQSFVNTSLIESEIITDKSQLLLHPELPEKTKILIEKMKLKSTDLVTRIETLKDFFSKADFIYTIRPGFYNNNLDDFLFIRKKGFCEHFAAAFATMARALAVPSRVVIGYQGGVYNSIGDFWKISQKDAHAWVEVLLAGRWVRVDPTALVSPLRITMGAEDFFSLSEEDQVFNSKNLSFKNEKTYLQIMNQFISVVDNINYQWTLFLLNYDLQTQLNYLKTFKGNKYWAFALIFTFFILFFINRSRNRPTSEKKHQLYRLINRIEKWGAGNGLEVSFSETPIQSFNRIAIKFPELKEFLTEVSGKYEGLIYKEEMATQDYNVLETRWSELTKSQ